MRSQVEPWRASERLQPSGRAKFCIAGQIETDFDAVVLNDQNLGVGKVALDPKVNSGQKGFEVMPTFYVGGPIAELIAAVTGGGMFHEYFHNLSVLLAGSNYRWAGRRALNDKTSRGPPRAHDCAVNGLLSGAR